MSSSEKLDNNITLHSGFVGRDTPIQYALINENTLAIGEASALKEFLAVSDDTPVPMIVQNEQLIALANSSVDSLGIYVKPAALLSIQSKAPLRFEPIIDRLVEKVVFPEDFEFIVRVNSNISFSGSGMFESATAAQTFASNLPGLIDEQFKHIRKYLGSETATVDSMRNELSKMSFEAIDRKAQFPVRVPNRWQGTELLHLQKTVQRIANEMRSSKMDKADFTEQGDLLSPEDARIQGFAKKVRNKYEIAVSNEAPELTGDKDIKSIVKKLANGVRGGGVYKDLTFRLPLNDQTTVNRVAMFLAWQGEDLIFSPYKTNNRVSRQIANTVASED